MMVSAWMGSLATYDGEAVAVSVVEKGVDPGTSFLAAACSSVATTCGGGLLLGSFDSDDQDVKPLLEGLGVGGRKGDNVRWHDDRRRGGGREQRVGCSAVKHCSTAAEPEKSGGG
jgi:hypothetical protein